MESWNFFSSINSHSYNTVTSEWTWSKKSLPLITLYKDAAGKWWLLFLCLLSSFYHTKQHGHQPLKEPQPGSTTSCAEPKFGSELFLWKHKRKLRQQTRVVILQVPAEKRNGRATWKQWAVPKLQLQHVPFMLLKQYLHHRGRPQAENVAFWSSHGGFLLHRGFPQHVLGGGDSLWTTH